MSLSLLSLYCQYLLVIVKAKKITNFHWNAVIFIRVHITGELVWTCLCNAVTNKDKSCNLGVTCLCNALVNKDKSYLLFLISQQHSCLEDVLCS
jgi:hypothetical protein